MPIVAAGLHSLILPSFPNNNNGLIVDDRREIDARLLAVLEERMRSMDAAQEKAEHQREADMREISARMRELVHLSRFRPVEAAVYGLVGIISTGLAAILVAKVWGGA